MNIVKAWLLSLLSWMCWEYDLIEQSSWEIGACQGPQLQGRPLNPGISCSYTWELEGNGPVMHNTLAVKPVERRERERAIKYCNHLITRHFQYALTCDAANILDLMWPSASCPTSNCLCTCLCTETSISCNQVLVDSDRPWESWSIRLFIFWTDSVCS